MLKLKLFPLNKRPASCSPRMKSAGCLFLQLAVLYCLHQCPWLLYCFTGRAKNIYCLPSNHSQRKFTSLCLNHIVSPAAQSKHTARLGPSGTLTVRSKRSRASLEVTWVQDFPWRLAEVAKSSGCYVVSM